ncbi:MAG: CBS domain-containing protein [Planctomycetia bacterium]|nr:CBS domain-containing protein [Planctomycetia bacterium]
MSQNGHDPLSSDDIVRSVTGLFHRLNSVLPTDQTLISVLPETPVQQALALLGKHGFSQLPVIVGQQVLGLFSYRSFSRAVIKLSGDAKNQKFNPLEMFVEDCIDRPTYARVTDEFRAWFDAIDKQDALLVGDPHRLQGIVTAMDILRYLYSIASPFVLIAEIELSLRGLIRLAVDHDELVACAKNCLKHYPEGKLPTDLEHMTFNDYVQIIGDDRSWNHFQPIFMGDRVRTRTKLKRAGELRNDVFHFRREITVEDYEELSALRDWMLLKATAVEARTKGGVA